MGQSQEAENRSFYSLASETWCPRSDFNGWISPNPSALYRPVTSCRKITSVVQALISVSLVSSKSSTALINILAYSLQSYIYFSSHHPGIVGRPKRADAKIQDVCGSPLTLNIFFLFCLPSLSLQCIFPLQYSHIASCVNQPGCLSLSLVVSLLPTPPEYIINTLWEPGHGDCEMPVCWITRIFCVLCVFLYYHQSHKTPW